MRRVLQSFWRNDRGVVAIEFSILLPLIIFLLFGSFELTRLVRASIRTTNAAQTIADLVAQQTNVTTAGMSNICTGGRLVMTPFAGTALTASAASVTKSNTGIRGVDWQDATCGGGSISTALSLATNYTPNANDSVIVVRVIYVYSPILNTLITSNFTMTRFAYARPRNGTTVTHS